MSDDSDRARSARERSAAYRDRRRRGAILVSVALGFAELRALERLNLLAEGERDPRQVAEAAERFLAALPAVAAIPKALYPET